MAEKTVNILALDEMDTAAFNSMMEEGLNQAKAGKGFSLEKTFAVLEQGV